MNLIAPCIGALRRIAIVDDNPFDNRFHGIILKKAGFVGELLVFESGEEVLAHLARPDTEPIDLMLLDINLPGASGFETAEAIMHGASIKPSLVIVVLTSSPDPGDVERARSIAIVREYLTKPLTVEGLGEVVSRHLPRA